MTRTTNARIAGVTFLFYIAAGVLSMVLFGRATKGDGIAAKLASIAQHPTDVGVVVVLSVLMCMSALVLGVTLYALTRDQDRDLAMMGLVCRVGEGLVGISMPTGPLLLWLATTTGTDAPDTGAAHALAAFLFKAGSVGTPVSATLFAVGSTCFSWLFLRGRMIPVWLAWLGVAASVLLVVALPLQLAGFFTGRFFDFMWAPMAVFEVVLAVWLMVKGAAMPTAR